MGFMDKAKQMAEQAQKKLDDVQQDFNQKQGQGQQQDGPTVQYDKHGRPIEPAEPEAPASAPAPPPAAPAPASGGETEPAPPAAEPAAPAPPPEAAPAAAAPPAQPAAPPPAPAPPPAAGEKDDSDDEGEPPKMTSGDPLAG
jgi:hypothetical protein